MAFTSGQWGPDTFIDNAGNTVLIGATVTAAGYVCTVDSLGNLTVTGPADDTVTLTVTPSTGAAYTQVVPVRPLVAELETVQGLAVAAETPAGSQAKADAAESAAETTAATLATAAQAAAIAAAATDATTKASAAQTAAVAAAATAASGTYPAKAGAETISGDWDFTGTVTGIGGGGAVSGVPTVINVKDAAYGATGDGSTDDSAAIQAAVTAAKTSGGPTQIYFPRGVYIYASTTPLDLADTTAISLVGGQQGRIDRQSAGGSQATATPPVELRFTAAGAHTCINAQGAQGFTIANMAVRYSSGSYTGRFIDAGSGGSITPSYGFTARNVLIAGSTDSAVNAACLVYLDGIVEAHFENFALCRAVVGVIGMDSGTTSGFANGITFSSGRFADCSSAAMLNPDQQTTFIGVVFEPTSAGAPAPSPVKSSSGARPVQGLSFIGCGWWDAPDAGYWIDVYGRGVSVFGGFCDSLGASGGLVRVNTDGTLADFTGLTIKGVGFKTDSGVPWTTGGAGSFYNIDVGPFPGIADNSGAITGTLAFAPLRGTETYADLGNSGASKTLRRDNVQKLTLTANCTLTFPTVVATFAHSFTLELVQDGTGSRTVTWPGSVAWGDAGAPTLSTTANKVDVLTFYTRDGGTTWRGFLGGSGF